MAVIIRSGGARSGTYRCDALFAFRVHDGYGRKTWYELGTNLRDNESSKYQLHQTACRVKLDSDFFTVDRFMGLRGKPCQGSEDTSVEKQKVTNDAKGTNRTPDLEHEVHRAPN